MSSLKQYACPGCFEHLADADHQWCFTCDEEVFPIRASNEGCLASDMEAESFWCDSCSASRNFSDHHNCHLNEVLARLADLGRAADQCGRQFTLMFDNQKALNARLKEPDQLELPELVADEKVAKAVESLMKRLNDLSTNLETRQEQMVRPLNLAVNDLETKLDTLTTKIRHAVDHQVTLKEDIVKLKTSLGHQGGFIALQKKLIDKMLEEMAQLREQAESSGSIFD